MKIPSPLFLFTSTTIVQGFTLNQSTKTQTFLQSSRRDWITSSLAITTTLVSSPNPSFAAGKPPTADDLNRIKVGYQNIQYLLDNFEKETTVCLTDGGRECKRDAEPVRRYLGLRSTKDVLFQIEKVFDKVKYMDIDPDKIEDFFQATEDWYVSFLVYYKH